MNSQRVLGVLLSCQRRHLSRRAQSILTTDILGNFEVQSLSRVHAQLRSFIPESSLPEFHPGNTYGGETMANSLLAASRIVTPGKSHQPSSVTVEFLRHGNYLVPTEFSVTKMHETHQFMQASVFVKQKERAVALSSVAFHFEEHGRTALSYDPTFPDVPSADKLPFTDSWFQDEQAADNLDASTSVSSFFLPKPLGVQVKTVNPNSLLQLNKEPNARHMFWVRANPDGINEILPSLGEFWSSALLAYISDFCLLAPAITQRPGFRFRSLNQAIWFFGNRNMARPTEWILMDLKLLHTGNHRCLCELLMWSEDRKSLLAVCQQQGLIRPAGKKN